MLHGIVPETILPRSSIALLGPAWSISLEWQFYLVAPLLFLFLDKGRGPAWLIFGGLAGIGWLLRYSPPFNVWFPMEAFLPQKLLLFGVGIISHEIWRAVHDFHERIAPALLGLAGLLVLFTSPFDSRSRSGWRRWRRLFAPARWAKVAVEFDAFPGAGPRFLQHLPVRHMLDLVGLAGRLIFRVARLPDHFPANARGAFQSSGAPLILVLFIAWCIVG